MNRGLSVRLSDQNTDPMSPEERVLKTEDAFGGLRPEQATRKDEIRARLERATPGPPVFATDYEFMAHGYEDVAYLLEGVEKLERAAYEVGLQSDREKVAQVLDPMIRFWRGRRDEAKDEESRVMAVCYVDAIQSVRTTLLGELLGAAQ